MADVETLFSRPVSPNELGGAYGEVLDEIRDTLKQFGIDVRRRRSIREIVMEYLVNIDIHRPSATPPPSSSLIELRKQDDNTIVVEMQGWATPKGLSRMQKLVTEYRKHNEDWLWSERDKISRSGDKPFKTDGSGLGLLTIAALSRGGPIELSSETRGGVPYFTLSSRV